MKRVLFISHSKRGAFYYNDASARYRCVFPAEHLCDLGITCNVIHFDKISAVDLNTYSYIIFHRPQYSLKLRYYLYKISRLGIKTIADFDDLLFNPDLASQGAAVQAGYMSQRLALKHSQAYNKALKLFSHCWLSTTALAEQLKISHPYIQSTVCYNKLPKRWGQLQAITPWQERLENKIIRYMPGTSHHKHDFEKVENLLVKVLKDDPSIHLEIVGALKFNIANFPKEQISHQNHMTFEQLPSAIHTSWLTLAPLQNNIFNQCKSGLKFWESGLYGIPVISSQLEDIQRFKNKGLCISDDVQHWLNFIEDMKNPNTYKEACDNAYLSANESVFNKKIIDQRLMDLGIKNKIKYTNTVSKNAADINFECQQLIMSTNIGPRWPSINLDPTYPEHNKAVTLISDTDQFHHQLDESKIDRLKKSEALKIEQDKPQSKSVIRRKTKKLWNSPYEFFRDMKF